MSILSKSGRTWNALSWSRGRGTSGNQLAAMASPCFRIVLISLFHTAWNSLSLAELLLCVAHVYAQLCTTISSRHILHDWPKLLGKAITDGQALSIMHWHEHIRANKSVLIMADNLMWCREDERLKRIRDEGYDRFAPINEANRPPDSMPSKRPPVDSDSD